MLSRWDTEIDSRHMNAVYKILKLTRRMNAVYMWDIEIDSRHMSTVHMRYWNWQ